MSDTITRQSLSRHHCPECLRPVPEDGEYCPTCGHTVRPSEPTETDNDPESERASSVTTDWHPNVTGFERANYLGAGVLAAFLVGTAMLVWISFGPSIPNAPSSPVDDTSETARADREPTEEPPPPSPATALPDWSYELGTDERIDHRVATITASSDALLRLYTPKGTPFGSLERRIEHVELRLEWSAARHRATAASGQSGKVTVEKADGDRHRVLWHGPRGDSTGLVTLSPADTRHANQLRDNPLSTRELAETFAASLSEAFERRPSS